MGAPDAGPGGLGGRWDLVVAGTGLAEAAVAAAAARAGAQVLHVDPSGRYGGPAGSLPLEEFLAELGGGRARDAREGAESSAAPPSLPPPGQSEVALGCAAAERWSGLEVWRRPGADLGASRDFSLDLSGPRLLLGAGSLVRMLVRAGCHQYLEFQPVAASVVWGAGVGGGLLRVPGSQAEVFRERSLLPSDKRLLMRFLKSEMAALLEAEEGAKVGTTGAAAETPVPPGAGGPVSFEEHLAAQGLPPSLRSTVHYALALADSDQGAGGGGAGGALDREEGRARVGTYLRSVGRFGAGQGAFLAPLWGSGELPQAFCRSCAVKGGVYRLNCAPVAVVLEGDDRSPGEKPSSRVAGVRLSTGETVRCESLLLSPDIGAAEVDGGELDGAGAGSISRAVCVAEGMLPDLPANTVITFPPGAVGNPSVVRCLQSGAGTKVAPAGRGALTFSTRASPGSSAREDLQAAVEAVVDTAGLTASAEGERDPVGGMRGGASGAAAPAGEAAVRPRALLTAYYRQALGPRKLGPELAAAGKCAQSAAPDGSLTLEGAAAGAEATFTALFPGKDFFPEGAPADLELEEDREVAELLSDALKRAVPARAAGDEAETGPASPKGGGD